MRLIFNHNEHLAPEELAKLADLDLCLILRMIDRGCPTAEGKLSLSEFVHWSRSHFRECLAEFDVKGLPAEGSFSESSQYWTVRPVEEWILHEGGKWLGIGGPGVDGISWALMSGEHGVYAYYPIDRAFIWKAADGPALIAGYECGHIVV